MQSPLATAAPGLLVRLARSFVSLARLARSFVSLARSSRSLILLLALAARASAAAPTYRPLFVGLECFADGWGPLGCPHAGLCAPGTVDGCALWRSGVFVMPPAYSWPPAPQPGPCASRISDENGTFVGGVWTPTNSSCRLVPHSAWQAASALRGKRVVLSGDSMVRQLFIRLVAALRGATVVAQPAQFVFHSSAIYAMNGTHDWLCVRPWQGEGQVTLGPPCAPPPVERPWVTLRYLWSPERLPSEAPAPGAPPDPEGLTAADLAADVTVAGLMFWLPWNDTLKAHLPAMSAAAARSRRLFWLATPGEHYAPRNDAVRAWARGQPAVRVLALDKLRADGSYTEQDWHHFECKVDLRLGPGVGENGNCTDPFDTINTNLVQMMLNSL